MERLNWSALQPHQTLPDTSLLYYKQVSVEAVSAARSDNSVSKNNGDILRTNFLYKNNAVIPFFPLASLITNTIKTLTPLRL